MPWQPIRPSWDERPRRGGNLTAADLTDFVDPADRTNVALSDGYEAVSPPGCWAPPSPTRHRGRLGKHFELALVRQALAAVAAWKCQDRNMGRAEIAAMRRLAVRESG